MKSAYTGVVPSRKSRDRAAKTYAELRRGIGDERAARLCIDVLVRLHNFWAWCDGGEPYAGDVTRWPGEALFSWVDRVALGVRAHSRKVRERFEERRGVLHREQPRTGEGT